MAESERSGWAWWRQRGEEGLEDGDQDAALGDREPPPVLLDQSALRTRYQTADATSFMFISLFGMTTDAIAERAELVDEELSQKGLIPIYLVDEAEFSALRAERRLFEYLPSHAKGACQAPDLDWPFYLRRRYLLLQAKWQPIGRIDFGDIPSWLPDHQEILGTDDEKRPGT